MRTGERCAACFCALALSCGGGGGGGDGGNASATVDETSSTTQATTSSSSEAEAGTLVDSGSESAGTPEPYPPPDAWPPNTGPGGPQVTFASDDLFVNCAFLTGGDTDFDHHNLVVMFDGYLAMPWAPEFSGGGLSFFDVSDPCAPAMIGSGVSDELRESHAVGFANIDARWYAVLAQKRYGLLSGQGGIQFWDVTDTAAPGPLSKLELPGHLYPDAYARVTLSTFWQVPYVFVGSSDNGVHVIDARDPAAPVLVATHALEPTLRVGQVQAVGDVLVATAAEGPRTVLVDISVPDFPQPIAGGDFALLDDQAMPREAYFANIGAGMVFYAIKNLDAGVLAYDIHDPSAPVYAGHLGSGGNGGYVFVKDNFAFVGESDFATIYDVSDPGAMTVVATLDLDGDLDTMTPIGNVAVLSVDDEGMADQASAIAPWQTEPDSLPPRVTWSVPDDGATGLVPTSRVGVVMNEMVDVKSAWAGSVRLYRSDLPPDEGRVDGWVSVQENVVNFTPRELLSPATSYTFEIPAGGIVDYNGNAIAEPFSLTFTTAGG